MHSNKIPGRLLFLFILAFAFGAPSAEAQVKQVKIDEHQLTEDLKTLSSDAMEGRRAGTEGSRRAAAFLVNRFKEEGALPVINDDFRVPFVFTSRDGTEINGTNILGKIEGRTGQQIVISAHYDHLGIRNGEIYNGADDDASGTAALLQIMAWFRQNKPEHTLIFAAFDAEESGLRGSRDFVETYAGIGKVKLNINMDMISINDKNELYAAGTHHYPELKPVLETVETGDITLLFGHDVAGGELDDWTFSSDHGPFHTAGIPFVYFGVEDHPHYHKPTDVFENVPLPFYKAAVKVVLNTVIAFDEQ